MTACRTQVSRGKVNTVRLESAMIAGFQSTKVDFVPLIAVTLVACAQVNSVGRRVTFRLSEARFPGQGPGSLGQPPAN